MQLAVEVLLTSSVAAVAAVLPSKTQQFQQDKTMSSQWAVLVVHHLLAP
jgi:hypothetical protein